MQQKAAEAPQKMADQNLAQAYAYGMPKDLLDQNILTGIYRGDPEAKEIASQSLSTVKELEKQEKRESEYLKLQKSELEKLASFSPTPADFTTIVEVAGGEDEMKFKALDFDTMYKAIQARMRIDGSSDDPAVFKMLSDKFIIDPEEAVKSGLSPEEVLRTQLNFISFLSSSNKVMLPEILANNFAFLQTG